MKVVVVLFVVVNEDVVENEGVPRGYYIFVPVHDDLEGPVRPRKAARYMATRGIGLPWNTFANSRPGFSSWTLDK